MFKKLDIIDESTGDIYLRRWVLFRCRWFRVFLHRIYKADKGRNLHNHPWVGVCLVLRGRYRQLRTGSFPKTNWLHSNKVRFFNYLNKDMYHRITWVSPNLWTLCVAGPYFRDWGFIVDGVHIPWRTHLNLPEEATLDD